MTEKTSLVDGNLLGGRDVPLDILSLKALLNDGHELALIDVRNEIDYVRGHILYAVNLPRSRLELLIRTHVPRFDTRIVLTDGGEGLAKEAAELLLAAGYSDVRLLAGGNVSWTKAGFRLYTGRNVVAIGFAEVVEHELRTPNISAVDLKARLDRGDDILVIDIRPQDEFESFRIPGAINVPGVDVVHRLDTLPIGPETLLVTHCAGRTRSIFAAQTLIDAGVANPVVSLTGGTMEWLIAGYGLEQGPGRTAPFPSPDTLTDIRLRARKLTEDTSTRYIDGATLARFKADTCRTLYLFDVRSPEEYVSGHLPGFRSAPGGQLVANPERYAAVRGARIVLHDTEGVRDSVSAAWLAQQGGNEVFVLNQSGLDGEWESGAEAVRVLAAPGGTAPFVLPSTLADWLAQDKVRLFDIGGGRAYRKGHIPGAIYASRQELEEVAGKRGALVVTSENGLIAHYVAADLRTRLHADIHVLLGGTAAWIDEKRAVEHNGLPADRGDDLPDSYALEPALRDVAFRTYLDWEHSLISLLGADADAQARYRIRKR